MDTKFTASDLRTKIKLYSKKGYFYTIRKLEKDYNIKIKFLSDYTCNSYSKEGVVYLGIMERTDDPGYKEVLFHELQHINDFDKGNGDAEYKVTPW